MPPSSQGVVTLTGTPGVGIPVGTLLALSTGEIVTTTNPACVGPDGSTRVQIARNNELRQIPVGTLVRLTPTGALLTVSNASDVPQGIIQGAVDVPLTPDIKARVLPRSRYAIIRDDKDWWD